MALNNMVLALAKAAGGLTPAEIQEMIRLYGGYRPVAAFNDITTQKPTGDATDVVTNVLFGPGGVSGDGVISVDSSGIITQEKSGYWFLKTRLRAKRTGSSGTSELFFQFYRRDDDLSPWLPFGVSVDIELDNARQTEVVLDESFFNSVAGVQYYLGWARSDDGSNSGDLVAGIPNATLASLGVQDSPSAQITVFTMADYNYDQ